MLVAISAQGSAGTAAVQELLASNIAQPRGNETVSTDILPPYSTTLDISPGTDISQLVALRSKNQSQESAKSVRTSWKTSPTEEQAHLHANVLPKPPSERQLLARKIHEIIRLEAEQGSSTGLNRQVRWKKAAGSTNDAKASLAGNSANAQMAAQAGSTAVSAKISLKRNYTLTR